jgi:hypothetical protein
MPSITGKRLRNGIVAADRDGLALAELTRRGGAGVLALGEDVDDDFAVAEHALEAVILAADRPSGRR